MKGESNYHSSVGDIYLVETWGRFHLLVAAKRPQKTRRRWQNSVHSGHGFSLCSTSYILENFWGTNDNDCASFETKHIGVMKQEIPQKRGNRDTVK